MCRTIVFSFLFLLVGEAYAQAQATSLQDAVDRAIDASFEVDQGELRLKTAEFAINKAKNDQYPTLNFSANGGYSFGLNVDPTTNDLVQQRIGFNSYRLDAGATLYAGGRLRKAVAKSKLNASASKADLEQIKQDITLAVAQSYLNALFAKEQIAASTAQVKQSQEALKFLDRQIELGSAAPINRAQALSDIARNEQTLIQAQNQLELAKLRLRQAFRMSPEEPLQLEVPSSIDFDAVELPAVGLSELFSAAITRQPSIEAAKLSEQVALADIEIAETGRQPVLSAFGNMDTRYSSQAMRFNTQTLSLEAIPYGQQLEDFFGQSVGLNLRVPIFNNGLVNNNIQNAKVQAEQARVFTMQERQRLEIEVQQALQAAKASKLEMEAARKSLNAAQVAYDAARKNALIGNASQIEVTNTQLVLEQAQSTEIGARYTYLFNVKVVDFYLGRPLTLD